MMKNELSPNFTLAEFEASAWATAHGVDNSVRDEVVYEAIVELVSCVLQPLRDLCGVPLVINSGYRSETVNEGVGGKPGSQHRKGEAADIVAVGLEPTELARIVCSTPAIWAQVDQMILYPNFLHLSHRQGGGTQRQMLLYGRTKSPTGN